MDWFSRPCNAPSFFDIDGTLTRERTWKAIIEYFRQRRQRRIVHLQFLAAHYPIFFLFRLGLISNSNFRRPWAAHLAWYFGGLTLEESAPIWDWGVKNYLSQYWREDTCSILESRRQSGDLVMLVSSGPLPMVKRIAAELGADHCVGTTFEVRAGRYTGKAVEPIVIDEIKASATLAYLTTNGIEVDLSSSYAYADSAPDLSMLEMVGHPVATYPDSELRKIAVQRGWEIFPTVG